MAVFVMEIRVLTPDMKKADPAKSRKQLSLSEN